MYARMGPSCGLETSLPTSSWLFLQNEQRSTSFRLRLPAMLPSMPRVDEVKALKLGAKSVCGGPQGAGPLLFFVVSEDRVADYDALVADVGAAGKLRRIGNERIYLVFGFAAK
jgi:hypothetical protein